MTYLWSGEYRLLLLVADDADRARNFVVKSFALSTASVSVGLIAPGAALRIRDRQARSSPAACRCPSAQRYERIGLEASDADLEFAWQTSGTAARSLRSAACAGTTMQNAEDGAEQRRIMPIQ